MYVNVVTHELIALTIHVDYLFYSCILARISGLGLDQFKKFDPKVSELCRVTNQDCNIGPDLTLLGHTY